MQTNYMMLRYVFALKIRIRLWRKNRSINEGTKCVGVDLNRNWDYNWGGEGQLMVQLHSCTLLYRIYHCNFGEFSHYIMMIICITWLSLFCLMYGKLHGQYQPLAGQYLILDWSSQNHFKSFSSLGFQTIFLKLDTWGKTPKGSVQYQPHRAYTWAYILYVL